jgi:hypothetical protein
VLEHIEDDVSILKMMFKKLKSGGRIYIFVPAFLCLYSSFDKKVGHLRRYTKKELYHKIEQAGFQIEKAWYFDCIGFCAAWDYTFLDKGNADLNKKQILFYDRIVFPISLFFDSFFQYFFGKNVEIVAKKPQ